MKQKPDFSAEEENVSEELLPLVGGFLQRRLAEIPILREALSKNDFGTVKLLGHRLKGNGASFGFPSLSRLGAALETSASANDKAGALRLTESVEKTVVNFQRNFGA